MHHWQILTLLGLPFMAVILLSLIERAPQPLPPALRIAQVGWDMCVLAAGATPGIFESRPVLQKLGNEASAPYGFAYLIACFIAGAIIGRIRSRPNIGFFAAVAAIAIGGAMLGGLVAFVW
jgi:hypothetical protein